MSLDGQTALLTGGTGGIGREVLLRLLRQGVHVIVVGRDATRGEHLRTEMAAQVPGSAITFFASDLARMGDVVALAARINAQYARLDMLVHCAGVMKRRRELTSEGLETVFAVQYLARFALTNALIDRLMATPDSRIVNVSAGGEYNMRLDYDNLNGEKGYNGVRALIHESVANDMFTLELLARYPQQRVYCYGPGYVRTTLLRDMSPWLRGFSATFGQLIAIAPGHAADDVLSLLSGEHPGGLYKRSKRGEGHDVRRNTPSDYKADPAQRERLWQTSMAMIDGARGTAPGD